jgi:hypothetical protein
MRVSRKTTTNHSSLNPRAVLSATDWVMTTTARKAARSIAAAQSRTRGPTADAWSASHRATIADDPSRIRGVELPPSANTR